MYHPIKVEEARNGVIIHIRQSTPYGVEDTLMTYVVQTNHASDLPELQAEKKTTACFWMPKVKLWIGFIVESSPVTSGPPDEWYRDLGRFTDLPAPSEKDIERAEKENTFLIRS